MQGPESLTAEDLMKISSELRHLLVEGITARRQLGPGLATPEFENAGQDLLRRLDQMTSPPELFALATEALETFENHTRRATGYLCEQSGQMQSIVAMLTETVADIAGQSDASVARLQSVERQIEQASGLENIRELKASLADCLANVKEAVNQQRNATRTTVERLREHIQRAGAPAAAAVAASRGAGAGQEYLVAIKLQRAEHILARFGEGTVAQMLVLIAEGLKHAAGPEDRLVRWNGPCFVMFLRSAETLLAIRRRLSAAVVKIGQRYVEAGTNSALLAVGVDWLIFPQSQYPSNEAAFAEVESFLAGKTEEGVQGREKEGKAAGLPANRSGRQEEPYGGVSR
jgi:GGDEF domain-containing protein